MKKSLTSESDILLVGVKARTNNQSEGDPAKAIIGKTIEGYITDKIADSTPNRVKPGAMHCVYTEYDSDQHGDYTYFVGEQVSSFDSVDDSLATLTIPASTYAKFECGPGQMPMTCIDAWQRIWRMSEQDLGSKRKYIADFEIYDERASDPARAVFDIYIGVE